MTCCQTKKEKKATKPESIYVPEGIEIKHDLMSLENEVETENKVAKGITHGYSKRSITGTYFHNNKSNIISLI